MRFTSTLINEQKMAEDLCKSLKERTKADLELSGYRKASARHAPNGCDFLVFVEDGGSFALLYDDANWSHSLLDLAFTRPSTPPIPPQLSLIVKNVSISLDLSNFANDVKATFASVRNVIRMKNKDQRNIELVKLELCDSVQRGEILSR